MRLPYLVVVGSHTDVGKSAVSAALCYGLGLAYHKIVQAGTPTDSDVIATLTPDTHIIPSAITLQTPTSPHRAKKLESLHYDALELPLPTRTTPETTILIETAGGLYTPIDSTHCVLDWVAYHHLPVVLVGRHYLGAINHILLSIEALKTRNIDILGLIISGARDSQAYDSEEFITQYSQMPIAHLREFDKDTLHVREDFARVACELVIELNTLYHIQELLYTH